MVENTAVCTEEMNVFDEIKVPFFGGCTSILVRCPKCGSLGEVTMNSQTHLTEFDCRKCHFHEVESPKTITFIASVDCPVCGIHFRQYCGRESFDTPQLDMECPYCGHMWEEGISCVVRRIGRTKENDLFREPYFGYELYYQQVYAGMRIWALNKEHLQYLIRFLKENREKVYHIMPGMKLPWYVYGTEDSKGLWNALSVMCEEKPE